MKEESKFICLLSLWAKHPHLHWLRSIELSYLHWLHCQCKLDYYAKYLHALILSGTLLTENLRARAGKLKLKSVLRISWKYLPIHGSLCFQVKQVCDVQPFVEQIRAFSSQILKQIWHDTWWDVMLTSSTERGEHPLPLKNSSSSTEKQAKGLEFAIRHGWVKAFSQLLVSCRL